ncbi:MAG: aldehyde dehydrogenase [Deltaproteobacteria bacterium]|nr:aldehyde dehydrogenase [Deltaproteobacteria bacterium]
MAKILIRNEWQESLSRRSRPVTNPSTLEKIDEVPEGNAEDVDHAVRAAREAQINWKMVTGLEKADLLHHVARKIREDRREIAKLLTLEAGKPLIESLDCVEWVAACFDYYAEIGRHERGSSLPPVGRHQVNFTIKEPYGVVACIVPFNFPLLLMSWKVAPAIAAGNCVVIKPPEVAPLSTLRLAKSFEKLPPGVINIVTGSGEEAGEALVRHPNVNMIAFTGSNNIGKRIMRLAADHIKKINLELGGIDPLIVFEDADLDVAVPGTAWARFLNAGQVCTSSKRIYVVEKVADEFIRRLVEHTKTLRVGNPIDPETDIGPMISEEQLKRVERQVAEGIKQGGKLLYGGKRVPGQNGWFYLPTVITDVRPDNLLFTEEVFGPVAAIARVKDAEEAIRLANDSPYGLGASIYTKSLETAMKAMEEIKAGSFWINDPLSDNDAGPFGGMRQSGLGRELGTEGLDAFRETKHVHLDYMMEKKDYWFPYKDRPIH